MPNIPRSFLPRGLVVMARTKWPFSKPHLLTSAMGMAAAERHSNASKEDRGVEYGMQINYGYHLISAVLNVANVFRMCLLTNSNK